MTTISRSSRELERQQRLSSGLRRRLGAPDQRRPDTAVVEEVAEGEDGQRRWRPGRSHTGEQPGGHERPDQPTRARRSRAVVSTTAPVTARRSDVPRAHMFARGARAAARRARRRRSRLVGAVLTRRRPRSTLGRQPRAAPPRIARSSMTAAYALTGGGTDTQAPLSGVSPGGGMRPMRRRQDQRRVVKVPSAQTRLIDVQAPRQTPSSIPLRRTRRAVTPPACRFCGAALQHTFVDLGMSPLCESYVPAERVNAMEPFYPLHAKVCQSCLLVQLEEFVTADEIFSEYAYFSSYSDSWVEHARSYVEMAVAAVRARTTRASVVELASNDGYLLQHVVARGIPALGIEPAANVAEVARAQGIETIVEFFGRDLARRLGDEGRSADLLAANNVHGARSRPQRLRRRHRRSCSRPAGSRRSRCRTCFGSSRATSSTRSTTSTSPTSRCSPRARCSRRTAWSCSTSRSCDPTAARCGCTPSAPRPAATPVTSAVGELAQRERALGLRHARRPPLVRPSGQRDQVESAGVPDRAPAGGQAHRRLRGARARATRS